MSKQPVLFVSHGAPTLALETDGAAAQLRAWGGGLAKPRAILVVSAHWTPREVITGVEATQPLIYDFSGFPAALSKLEYRAPGAPELAARVRALTGAHAEPDRGWDHGVWVPLRHMFPDADVPVLQVAMPYRKGPEAWWAFGRALAPLRDDGVLIIGSGGMVHNLGQLAWDGEGATAPWAAEFDAWVAAALSAGRTDDLRLITERAPSLRAAHPGYDHLAPLVVATAAAVSDDGALPPVTFPVTGFVMGSLSMRSVQFGNPSVRLG